MRILRGIGVLASSSRSWVVRPASRDRGSASSAAKRPSTARSGTRPSQRLPRRSGSTPRPTAPHYNRGYAYAEKREYAKAIADFNEAIRLEPNDPMGHSALAWTLATGSDAALRDGKRAIELANRAIKLSKGKDANDFENLAAAYAECGRFDEAVKWQARAIELGTGLLDPNEAEDRLELYEAGKPFREK